MLTLFLLAGCQREETSPQTAGKPLVVTTIFAYYDAARAIADDKAMVRIILPPQASPHDYQPSLKDKELVTRAQLFITNGLGIDNRLLELAADSKAQKLVIGDIIAKDQVLKTEEIPLGNTRNSDEDASLGNPHIWLDPLIQMKAAEAIHDSLVSVDPADKPAFDANLQKYQDDLKALDKEFSDAVKTFKSRDFIGFHSAYDYLAHRYGLHQVAAIEEIPDAGLSLAQIQKILQIIKEKNIHYVAIETALSAQGTIDKIKQEGHVETIVLQPLETYDNANDTYVSLMRQNLASLKTALGG